MQPDGPTLRDRYAADLRSGSLAVQATAVPLALAAGFAASASVHAFAPTFLLLVLVGVQVPALHERLGADDAGWLRDVGWTVVVSALTVAGFGLGYALAAAVLNVGPVVAATLAYLATTVAGLALVGAVDGRPVAGRSRE